MGIDDNDLTPEQRAEILLGKLHKNQPDATPYSETGTTTFEWDHDLVPHVEPDLPRHLQELDDFLDSISIVDAYIKFCGKMIPDPKGRTESIMVSCPVPGHVDNNPSAWLNADKKVWHCGACQQGGDLYDLAAIHYGYSWPSGYKTQEHFPSLKREIAKSYGLNTVTGITGEIFLTGSSEPEDPPEELEPELEPELESATSTPVASVTTIFEEYDEPTSVDSSDIFIDWESIVPEDTFLYEWIKALATDAIPDEYHFWIGVLASGLAGGRNNILLDRKNVKANFFLCLYGETGIGKTQAIDPLEELFTEVLPWDDTDPYNDPTGVYLIPAPSSGEAFIDSFSFEVLDPSTQRAIRNAGVTGLLSQNEFSELVKKSDRLGSSLKEVLIGLFDAGEGQSVSTHARSSGKKQAVSPFCSLISSTQPKAINNYLARVDIESGTLNRFIYAHGHPRRDALPYASREPDLTNAIEAYRQTVLWANPGHNFKLEGSGADPVWVDFFNRELKPIKMGIKRQDSIYARTDLLLKKILVAFCVNERKAQPDADLMERVLSLYDYLRLTFSMFSDDLSITALGELEKNITEFIITFEQDKGKPPTRRDMNRKFLSRHDSEDLIRAIKNLTSIGQISEEPVQGKRGPGTVAYRAIV